MAARRACVAIVLVLLAGVAASAARFHHTLFGARTTTEVAVEIPSGTPVRQILALLHEKDLVPSPLTARLYLRLHSRGRALRFGHYLFAPGSRPADVLEKVLAGGVETFLITVPEGSDATFIGEEFARLGVGTREEWEELVGRVEWLDSLAPEAPSLEGFFFPDTYRFPVGISAEAAAHHLVDRFLAVWQEETADSTPLWGTPLEVVTLASLVEAETSLAEERPLVAGVYRNRLERGMLLQCDPTVIYALKRRGEWHGRLYRIHWDVEDPYNTYRHPGLPPGPINNPGRAAIAAAVRPEESSYLYFVARPGGGHTFSRTLAEHNRAVAELRASRR